MVLISSYVFPRSEQLVIHTRDVAADAGHLDGNVDRALLSLRLQLYCLLEKERRTQTN